MAFSLKCTGACSGEKARASLAASFAFDLTSSSFAGSHRSSTPLTSASLDRGAADTLMGALSDPSHRTGCHSVQISISTCGVPETLPRPSLVTCQRVQSLFCKTNIIQSQIVAQALDTELAFRRNTLTHTTRPFTCVHVTLVHCASACHVLVHALWGVS
jgi:hypothetical protein